MKNLLLIIICIFSLTAYAVPSDKKILDEFNKSRLSVCPNKYIPDYFGKDNVKTVSKYKSATIVTIAGSFRDGLNAIAFFAYVDGEFIPTAIKVSEIHDYKGVKVPKILKDADIASILTVELGESSPEAQALGTEGIYIYMSYCTD